jgi:glutathione peroxidase
MTIRQRILKSIYPAIMLMSKASRKVIDNKQHAVSIEPFYKLQAETNTGKTLQFESLKGKNILVVNTASNCGFTAQYDGLQKLYEQNQADLVILGFPSNDFKNQEEGTDADIAQFCKVNYGVTFPIMKKSHVVKGSKQNPIFDWLSNANKNGWCEQAPTWNFSKYLINKQGQLVRFYDSKTEPCNIELK